MCKRKVSTYFGGGIKLGFMLVNHVQFRASSAIIRFEGSKSSIRSSKSKAGGGINEKSSLNRRL